MVELAIAVEVSQIAKATAFRSEWITHAGVGVVHLRNAGRRVEVSQSCAVLVAFVAATRIFTLISIGVFRVCSGRTQEAHIVLAVTVSVTQNGVRAAIQSVGDAVVGVSVGEASWTLA